MATSKVVTLAASTARNVAVVSGLDTLEVLNIDGNDVVYVTARFSDVAESASAGVLPTPATIQGATTRVVPAVAGSSIQFEVDDDDATLAIVSLISPGTPKVSVSMFDTKRTGGGGGGSSPGSSADYTPYAFNLDATALDTVIAGLSPHAYLKMNDASGLPQDSSGNGRHATAISGATYSQAALTSKGNAGIRLTGAITLPPPVADPGSGIWSACFLAKWHDFDTNVNANGFPGILNWCGGSPPKFMLSTSFGAAADGRMSHLWDSQFADIGHASIAAHALELGKVYAFVIVARSDSGVLHSEVYVNGTPWCAAYREGDGVAGVTWDIGQNSGNNSPFFTSADWTISNYAQFAAALTYAQVEALTEAMLDSTAAAAAAVFTS